MKLAFIIEVSVFLGIYLCAILPMVIRKKRYKPGTLVEYRGEIRQIKHPLITMKEVILERKENSQYGSVDEMFVGAFAKMKEVRILNKYEISLLKLEQ